MNIMLWNIEESIEASISSVRAEVFINSHSFIIPAAEIIIMFISPVFLINSLWAAGNLLS